jgi:arylsulfatase A-like enzyme
MVGLKPLASFRGKSLLGSMTNNAAVNEYVFAGSAFTPAQSNPFFSYPSVIVSARSREWKLIVERVSPPSGAQESLELYDLQRDPEELTNVASRNPETLTKMKDALKMWLQGIDAARLLPGL